MLGPRLAPCLDDCIVLASWYSVEDYRALLCVVEREVGRAVREFVGFAEPSRGICETFTETGPSA